MAFIWSENSYAIRRHVGALIVKDNVIISDGYNGTPSKFPNICEYAVNDETDETVKAESTEELKKLSSLGYRLVTYPIVLHAESNAITKLAKLGSSSVGSTIYITDEPCMECSKLIIQAGIKRVVYARAYSSAKSGVSILQQAGIEVEHIPEETLNEQ